jgi:hypothetical protein
MPDRGDDVLAAGLGDGFGLRPGAEGLPAVDIDPEGEAVAVVADDEYRPGGEVLAGHHAIEIDERRFAGHRQAQSPVVAVLGVRASVVVDHEAGGIDLVLVGPGPPYDDGDGRDAQRHVEDGGLEDALGTHERDAPLFEDEAGGSRSLGRTSPRASTCWARKAKAATRTRLSTSVSESQRSSVRSVTWRFGVRL